MHLTMCWHLLHAECVSELIRHSREASCPTCRAPITATCSVSQKVVIRHPDSGGVPTEVSVPSQLIGNASEVRKCAVREGRLLSAREQAAMLADERARHRSSRARARDSLLAMALRQGVLQADMPRVAPQASSMEHPMEHSMEHSVDTIELERGSMPLHAELWSDVDHKRFIELGGLDASLERIRAETPGARIYFRRLLSGHADGERRSGLDRIERGIGKSTVGTRL